jgi:hypothetical protein
MAVYQGMLQQSTANNKNNNNINRDNNDRVVLQAKLLQAMSHVNPQKACQQWKEWDMDRVAAVGDNDYNDNDVESLDGQALEQQELPRLHHHYSFSNHANAPSSSFMTGVHGNNTNAAGAGGDRRNQKKNQAAVLRRRTKQRQAYLQDKGLTAKDKPDPERWIPKIERQRRRRRGGNNNKSSQGSGYSAKDAALLDVAARATGQVETKANSTAHMRVVGGSGKGGKKR